MRPAFRDMFRGLLPICRKEALHIVRDRGTLFFALLIPMLQLFLFGFAVLVYIANGSIDLSDLLSETGESKGASMSRFQLLIFTLVIALSLFLVVVSNMKFPDSIPPEILTLLGISASTYAVSKGIQASGNRTVTGSTAAPTPGPTITDTTASSSQQGAATSASAATTGNGGSGA